MAGGIDTWVERFRRLHTDRSASRWPAATTHRAPHKPLLLLSVIELIEVGLLTCNQIPLTIELAESFARLWSCVFPDRERGKIVYPFFHLRSEGFWSLVPQPGQASILAATRQVTTAAHLQKLVAHAQVDEALFAFLCDPPYRRILQLALIQEYFDPPTQDRLLAQVEVDRQSFEYSQLLLEAPDTGRVREPAGSPPHAGIVRDQGFRRAVVLAYLRRCTFCGVRVVTLEGHTAVDAAHIIPWSVSHDDRPMNGLALCRHCHWSFDAGMLSVSSTYSVLASPQLSTGQNMPAHLGTLQGRGILTPADRVHWPDPDAQKYHRDTVFKRR